MFSVELFAAVLYVVFGQMIDRHRLNVLTVVFFTILPPFVLQLVIDAVLSEGLSWVSIYHVLSAVKITTLIIQVICCYFVFWSIKYKIADDIAGYIVWLIGGGVVILYLVPSVVGKVLG